MRKPFKIVGIIFVFLIGSAIGLVQWGEHIDKVRRQERMDSINESYNKVRYEREAFKQIAYKYELKQDDKLDIWYCDVKGNVAMGNASITSNGKYFGCRFKLVFDDDGFMKECIIQ